VATSPPRTVSVQPLSSIAFGSSSPPVSITREYPISSHQSMFGHGTLNSTSATNLQTPVVLTPGASISTNPNSSWTPATPQIARVPQQVSNVPQRQVIAAEISTKSTSGGSLSLTSFARGPARTGVRQVSPRR
jgi:hypothetical protein